MSEFKCPTCDGFIPNNNTPGAYPGALSRRDNKTEVCSACGQREAIEDYFDVIQRAAQTRRSP